MSVLRNKFTPVQTAVAGMIVASATPLAASCQKVDDSRSRYGEITVLGGVALDVGTGSLTDLWKPTSGITFAVESPFIWGRLGLEYQNNQFRGDGSSLPNFRVHGVSGTWGLEVPAQSWLRFYGGVSVGGWVMRFSGPRSDEGNTVETEITGGAKGRVSVCPRDTPLCFSGSIGVTRVLTMPRITQKSASIGASVTLSSPGWIRQLLDGRPRERSTIVSESPSAADAPRPRQADADTIKTSAIDREISSGIGRTVITAEEIRRAGINRLGEVLTLVDSWSTTTVDGFSWWSAPNGHASPMDASPLVMVGDQLAEMGPGGVWNLDRLGLSLAQIDSVEVLASPQLIAGRFTTSGLVRFHPRKADSGPGGSWHGMLGNPTGDPGPDRYRPEHARNVNRVGEDMAAHLFTGNERWGVTAGFVQRNHNLTENRIRARPESASLGAPVIYLDAPSLLFHLGRRAEHSIQVLASRLDDHRYIPQRAREVPLRRDWIHTGINGALWRDQTRSLAYRAGMDFTAIDALPNRLGIDARKRFRFYTVDVELQANGGNAEPAAVGIGLDFESSDPVGPRASATAARVRAFGQKSWCVGTIACLSAQALGSVEGSGLGGHLRGTAVRNWRSGLWTSGSLSVEYAPDSFEDDILGLAEPATMSRRLSADVDFWADLGYGWSFAGSIFLRDDEPGRVLQDAVGSVAADLVPTVDSVLFDTDAGGWIGGSALTVRWISTKAGGRISYTVQDAIDATPGVMLRWALVPRHRFRQYFWLGIGDEATVQLSAEARSSVSLPHLVVEAEPDKQISAPGSLIFDLAFVKWLWGRRARGSLRVRDLMNSQAPIHPIGVAPGLTVFIRGDIVLPHPTGSFQR